MLSGREMYSPDYPTGYAVGYTVEGSSNGSLIAHCSLRSSVGWPNLTLLHLGGGSPVIAQVHA